MGNMTIPQYTAALTIDPVQDQFLLYQNSTNSYVKINRNTIMGNTGNPVDTSSSQTLTNKTLTSPLISSPVLSGTITGTYTLGGTPTFPSTVVTTTGTQTLTNKTIISPSISGGTIDQSTVTVDAITGHTTANSGTIYGVTISSGILGTNTVATASVTDGAITPAKLQTGTGSTWAWQSWTPTFTGLSGGTLTWGRYIQTGKTVFYRFLYTLAGTNVSGSVTFTLPLTTNANYSGTNNLIGEGMATIGGGYPLLAIWASSTTATLTAENTSSTYSVINLLSATVPNTWASGSTIMIQGSYEAA